MLAFVPSVLLDVCMKLFAVLGLLAGLYVYMLMHVTDTVLLQTKNLNSSYQQIAKQAEDIAAGRQ